MKATRIAYGKNINPGKYAALEEQVKSILLERTKRLRLGLLNLDTSCSAQALSTVSELPN